VVEKVERSLKTLTDQASRQKWIKEADKSYRGLVRIALRQRKAETALRIWECYRSRFVPFDVRTLSSTQKKSPWHSNSRTASLDSLDEQQLFLPNVPHA